MQIIYNLINIFLKINSIHSFKISIFLFALSLFFLFLNFGINFKIYLLNGFLFFKKIFLKDINFFF